MKFLRIIILLFLLLLAPSPSAEQLVLKNGDRITGAILQNEDGMVSIETEYAGTITIQQDQIQEIVSEEVKVDEAGDSAQEPVITPEAVVEEKPKKRLENWSGNVNLGFHWESDGANKLDFRTDAQGIYEKNKHKLTLKGAYKYGETDGDVDIRSWKFSTYWQYYLRERLYTYTLLESEQDDARKLDLSYDASAGIGYEVIKQERRFLSLGIGLGYTHEEWLPYSLTDKDTLKNSRRAQTTTQINALVSGLQNGSIPPSLGVARDLISSLLTLRDPFWMDTRRTENFINARGTLVFEQSLFEASKLREAITIIPNLGDLGEYQIESELTYTQPLNEKLQFRLRLLNEYDSSSDVKGIESLKSDLTASLGFVF
jgi:hypothetical protein